MVLLPNDYIVPISSEANEAEANNKSNQSTANNQLPSKNLLQTKFNLKPEVKVSQPTTSQWREQSGISSVLGRGYWIGPVCLQDIIMILSAQTKPFSTPFTSQQLEESLIELNDTFHSPPGNNTVWDAPKEYKLNSLDYRKLQNHLSFKAQVSILSSKYSNHILTLFIYNS